MNKNRVLAVTGLSLMLLLGGGGAATAVDTGHEGGSGPNCQVAGEPNAIGMQTQHAAQMHGGIAGATAWHNQHHDTDLTVGEHQQMIRDTCWVNPSGK